MKKNRIIRSLLGAGAVASLCLGPMDRAEGAGLLIAEGGFGGVLEIREHAVDVTINNGIAVTKVTQVFQNTENRQVEALYTFPVPKGASVAGFSMWINGKEMVGEVLEKERARQIYESYKQTRKDPGLLEQVDYKTFEMRIFPIAAQAEQRVELTYYQELEVDHDWSTYVYPLATVSKPGIDARTTGRFAINFEIKSEIPIAEMESPSHGNDFVVARHTEAYVQASLEQDGGRLDRDVVLACRYERPKTGIDLITTRPEGEDGYFCLTLTAGEDIKPLDEGMDYVFLLDVSGSMANDGKLGISRSSVEAFINELGEKDRFELLSFNVRPMTLFDSLQPASEPARTRASAFLEGQSARGGTVLNPAIQAAYRYGDPDRVLNVVILSDGMTEQRERQELLGLIQQRPRNARVFCIGVGNEVNRPLLEQLADDSGGLAAFVSRGDNFTRAAKAFRRKLLNPVAERISIEIDGVETYDVEPEKLPNLYHGSPVKIYGRYRGKGEAPVTLRADIRGRSFSRKADLAFPGAGDLNPELERMWAWKRVDRLLKEADRGGNRQPVLDEIVRLGEAYSIVTEYTSFLVLENEAEYKRWSIERRNALRIERDRKAQARLREELDTLRNRSLADVGPDAGPEKPTQLAMNQPQPGTSTPTVQPAPRPQTRRSVDFDFDLGGGSGPVGPLFLGLLALLRKMTSTRKKESHAG